jgi:hypothetical protein
MGHSQLRQSGQKPSIVCTCPAQEPSPSSVAHRCVHVSCVDNVFIRQMQAHAIQTQYPHLQRLMVTGKKSVGSIIKACIAVLTRRALPGGFRIITTALDDLCGCTSGARDAIWPASCADGLIPLHILDEMLDVDLHYWTPVKGRYMSWHPVYTILTSTTLASHKSAPRYPTTSLSMPKCGPPYTHGSHRVFHLIVWLLCHLTACTWAATPAV